MNNPEIIIGSLKIKRVDDLNWQIFEWREIKSNAPKARKGETDWIPMQAFYSSLKHALLKAKELNRINKIKDGTLDEAVEAIEKADVEFLKQLNKALKESGQCK